MCNSQDLQWVDVPLQLVLFLLLLRILLPFKPGVVHVSASSSRSERAATGGHDGAGTGQANPVQALGVRFGCTLSGKALRILLNKRGSFHGSTPQDAAIALALFRCESSSSCSAAPSPTPASMPTASSTRMQSRSPKCDSGVEELHGGGTRGRRGPLSRGLGTQDEMGRGLHRTSRRRGWIGCTPRARAQPGGTTCRRRSTRRSKTASRRAADPWLAGMAIHAARAALRRSLIAFPLRLCTLRAPPGETSRRRSRRRGPFVKYWTKYYFIQSTLRCEYAETVDANSA